MAQHTMVARAKMFGMQLLVGSVGALFIFFILSQFTSDQAVLTIVPLLAGLLLALQS